jgi:hypothetical protein
MFERAIKWLLSPSQVFCRHAWIRKLDEETCRYHLECMKCWKQTPGFDLSTRHPHTAFRK